MRREIFAALVLMTAAMTAHSTETFKGQTVEKKTMTISGGRSVEVSMTSSGAIPASVGKFTVEQGGPLLLPPAGDNTKHTLKIAFSILVKEATSVAELTINDVTLEQQSTVIHQINPEIKQIKFRDGSSDSFLMPRSDAIDASSPSNIWLTYPGNRYQIYEIIIKEDDGSTTTIYQPVLYTRDTKQVILKTTK